MPAFTSHRERSLWLQMLAVLIAIYATLGVARVGIEFLRERNLLRLTVAAMLLFAAAWIAVGIARRRPGRREAGVALAFAGVYAVALLAMERSEERLHLLEYGVVALLAHAALRERESHGGRILVPAWLGAILLTAGFGWLDEGIQMILPTRYYDLRDVGFNALAGVLAVAAARALETARRRDALPS